MGKADGSDRQVTTGPVDDTGAHILHVDMDAFYASVEVLDHPEYAGKPLIVGHATGRSVVSSASYEARRFGVRSAMPVAQALRLCPDAITVGPRMERYAELSRQVMQIFQRATPLVEPVSIDEAFLDVAGARKLLGSPAQVAARVRQWVREETGLPCSVGVAGTKFVAKLASGRAKPDGLLVVPVSETLGFLHPLPVGALWGVGPSTQSTLANLGLRTVADLAATPVEVLERRLGAGGRRLWELANGIDVRPVETQRVEKSIGHEQTFEHDVTDASTLRRELLRMSQQAAHRLRSAGAVGRTISLKLRYSDFRTISRSRTIGEPTAVGKRIYEEVAGLLGEAWRPGDRVRLIGVRVEQLEPDARSPLLWDPDEDWRDAERAVDDVSAKFGPGVVAPASLLGTRPRQVGESDHYRDRG
ncbi:DNA polymerase IV [Gryllotalpicola ginsengisoli]|uniref:DNA polymerase IV n=1 Tax=Gryllotalpicola ginsengisoli TaxID=444608 RepID=UPI0003B4A0D0|nr:DNA polymerase IV [Gryllotalpicola ginsengisoli]